jgi:hypothetical protein
MRKKCSYFRSLAYVSDVDIPALVTASIFINSDNKAHPPWSKEQNPRLTLVGHTSHKGRADALKSCPSIPVRVQKFCHKILIPSGKFSFHFKATFPLAVFNL